MKKYIKLQEANKMIKKLKSLWVVILTTVMIATSAPFATVISSAEVSQNAGNSDNFKIVREDPTMLHWDGKNVSYIAYSHSS